MLDSLRTTLYASLGAFSVAQEKLKTSIDDLVSRGELTKDQGAKVVETLAAKGEEESREFSERIQSELERWISKTPFAARQELERLEQRVTALEQRLAAEAPDVVEPSSEG